VKEGFPLTPRTHMNKITTGTARNFD